MRVLLAPDKFRGTLTALDACAAFAEPVRAAGHLPIDHPMADGGEGTLEALGGANRTSLVSGPLGDPVEAAWRLVRSTAVIEMAQASGLALVGGAEGNDPLAASTAGTGELLAEAVAAGARRIIVGVGGSATTDGGLGALRAMEPLGRFRGVRIDVACDVRIPFVDAAAVFGPQKGASDAQVRLLRRRLDALVGTYRDDFGVEVGSLPGGGAAGGLAGGLAAIGAKLVEGFDLVADETGLEDALDAADLVITGEGLLDEQSFRGKTVGGVVEMARDLGVRSLIVAGDATTDAPMGVDVISLRERFGIDRAMVATRDCVNEVLTEWFAVNGAAS